jgi:hypothetical protein
MSSRTAQATVPAGWRAYAAVLAVPRVRPLLISSAVGRLPLGMTGLAIVLVSRAAGFSYATAGFSVA